MKRLHMMRCTPTASTWSSEFWYGLQLLPRFSALCCWFPHALSRRALQGPPFDAYPGQAHLLKQHAEWVQENPKTAATAAVIGVVGVGAVVALLYSWLSSSSEDESKAKTPTPSSSAAAAKKEEEGDKKDEKNQKTAPKTASSTKK